MKILGLIGNEIVVIVDHDATHNFVSSKAVVELVIPVTEFNGCGVSLRHGDAVEGTSMCKGVVLTLVDGLMVEEDLSLGNFGDTMVEKSGGSDDELEITNNEIPISGKSTQR